MALKRGDTLSFIQIQYQRLLADPLPLLTGQLFKRLQIFPTRLQHSLQFVNIHIMFEPASVPLSLALTHKHYLSFF